MRLEWRGSPERKPTLQCPFRARRCRVVSTSATLLQPEGTQTLPGLGGGSGGGGVTAAVSVRRRRAGCAAPRLGAHNAHGVIVHGAAAVCAMAATVSEVRLRVCGCAGRSSAQSTAAWMCATASWQRCTAARSCHTDSGAACSLAHRSKQQRRHRRVNVKPATLGRCDVALRARRRCRSMGHCNVSELCCLCQWQQSLSCLHTAHRCWLAGRGDDSVCHPRVAASTCYARDEPRRRETHTRLRRLCAARQGGGGLPSCVVASFEHASLIPACCVRSPRLLLLHAPCFCTRSHISAAQRLLSYLARSYLFLGSSRAHSAIRPHSLTRRHLQRQPARRSWAVPSSP